MEEREVLVPKPRVFNPAGESWAGTLTSHHSNEKVQLLHRVAEGGGNQAGSCQTTTKYDDRSTAKPVHQDAADWS